MSAKAISARCVFSFLHAAKGRDDDVDDEGKMCAGRVSLVENKFFRSTHHLLPNDDDKTHKIKRSENM